MPTKNITTLTIPAEVTKEARKRAIDEGTSMSAVVTALLRAWLAGEIKVTGQKVQPTKVFQAQKKGGKRRIE